MKKLQRVLSLFLTIAMSVSFMSAAVYADDTEDTATAYTEVEEPVEDSVAEALEEAAPAPTPAPVEETPKAAEPEETVAPAETAAPTEAPEVTPAPDEEEPAVSAPEQETPETAAPAEEEVQGVIEMEYDELEDLVVEPQNAAVDNQRIEGTDLYWSLDDATGVLSIYAGEVSEDATPITDIPDYSGSASSRVSPISFTTAPWYGYRPYIKSIEIQEGVTGIGAYAFYSVYKELTSLTVAASVRSIGAYAFYNDTQLATIDFVNTEEIPRSYRA